MTTLDSLQLLVVGRYIDMAAGSIVIFDYLLTLHLEIKFIWKSKFNIMKVVYFINRYAIFLNFVLICIRATLTDTTHCPGLMKAEGVLYILGVYFSEYIFAMRTYVIWQKRKIVWIPLCIYYVGTLVFNFISYYSIIIPARYFLLHPFNGCLAELRASELWIPMLCLVAYDAAMIILISLAAINMWRSDTRVRSDLFRVLYGEGILFYIYLLAFSTALLVTVKVFQSNPYLFISMGRSVRSILASRVILHIREMSYNQLEYPCIDLEEYKASSISSLRPANPSALSVA